MRSIAVSLLLTSFVSQCLAKETPLAWQDTEHYRAPNFEEFFPDNPEGGEALDTLWRSRDRDSRPDEEILKTVRQGLRTCKNHKTIILRWIGNKYIWNKSPQNPEAIEIMYHAADFSGERADPYGTRHYAVYFGLSVVKEKTPSILRTLVDLCMKVDDPNDLSRVAWGAKSQRAGLLEYLDPYLKAEDEAVREKAEVVRRIFTGELKAFAWATEQAKKRAEEKYTDELPRIRETLKSGESEARRDVLRLIMRQRISLIMDDSFIEAFSAAASDPEARVRNDVARIVGGRWVWSAEKQNPEAIELMLRLSKDEDREVRYNAVYYGLSTVREKSPKVVRRLLEMAFEDREQNLYGRIAWGLGRDREAAKRVLNEVLAGDDAEAQKAAREVYKDMTGQAPPAE